MCIRDRIKVAHDHQVRVRVPSFNLDHYIGYIFQGEFSPRGGIPRWKVAANNHHFSGVSPDVSQRDQDLEVIWVRHVYRAESRGVRPIGKGNPAIRNSAVVPCPIPTDQIRLIPEPRARS